MDREFLKRFGLEDSQVKEILDQYHAQKQNEIDREVQKVQNKLDSALANSDSLKEELDKANSTIRTLERTNKDNENLTAEIQKYKNEIKEVQLQAKQDRIKNRVLFELKDAGCIDPELVVNLVDMTKVSENTDGQIFGISEQIDAIKSDSVRSTYFKQEEPVSTQPDYQPDRGGYEPARLNNNTSFDTSMTEQEDNFLNIIKSNTPSVDKGDPNAFWDSLG